MKLVIVESPAKAKTINKYLGEGFETIASFGHIRNLLSKPGSVLPEQDFALKYHISKESLKHVAELIKAAKDAKEVYLATDPDREGEAIAWHIVEVLKEQQIGLRSGFFKRIAFNEITRQAVLAAVARPREIDINLVNAQQARTALDYLFGFTLSPVLWRKLPGCRSAGRVQSVAVRLICNREEEIEKFVSREYWDITINAANKKGENFTARLVNIDGQKLEKFSITNEKDALAIVNELRQRHFTVTAIEKKQQRRNPSAPFITSSLQQEAARKLNFTAKKTMQIAQKLYEGIEVNGETIGLITYMRTDGVNLSQEAVKSIRTLINSKYGSKYLPSEARIYKSKVKNAQEAHEPIRPTDVTLLPKKIADSLTSDQLKLYSLIWQRTVACQMESAIINLMNVELTSKDGRFIARATGSNIGFDGFYKIYKEGSDDSEEEEERMLPLLVKDEEVTINGIRPEQHHTEPPPRYSEASLVKTLVDLGIGRPSTYAPIISVLQERRYTIIQNKRFIPSESGRLVTAFLAGFFHLYVEYNFTARLENELDRIAEGKLKWKKLLYDFWGDFNQNIAKVSNYQISEIITYLEKELDYRLFGAKDAPEYQHNKTCPACKNAELSLKLGRYGAFLACNNYPDCNFKRPIMIAGSKEENKDNFSSDLSRELGTDDKGNIIFLKKGPYGMYLELEEKKNAEKDTEIAELAADIKQNRTKSTKNEAANSKKKKPRKTPGNKTGKKPRRFSLPANFKLESLDLKTALKLLSLPVNLGNHPITAQEILMGIGRFGPYLKYQDKFISISKDIDPFTVDIDQAVKIIKAKSENKKAAKKVSTLRKKQ